MTVLVSIGSTRTGGDWGIKQHVTAQAGLDGPNHYSFFVTILPSTALRAGDFG
ncbi:hypothetical protein AB6H32_23190 [Providencia hangzhouensis]